MPQSLAKNLIHLVFSTKHRKPLLADTVRPHLHAYIATVFKNRQCPVLIINSVEDHVHILFNLHRTIALAAVVEEIKKSSSKWIKTQSPELRSFAWQPGYGAFSVSESNAEPVQKYIATQAYHHRKISFQDEFRRFLLKHKLDFDEHHLWG